MKTLSRNLLLVATSVGVLLVVVFVAGIFFAKSHYGQMDCRLPESQLRGVGDIQSRHDSQMVGEPLELHLSRSGGEVVWRLSCMGADLGKSKDDITARLQLMGKRFGYPRVLIMPADSTITLAETREALKFLRSLGYQQVEINDLISGINEAGRFDEMMKNTPPPPPPPPKQQP